MDIIKTVKDWVPEYRIIKSGCNTIGFVPTMGALHVGHGSLIRKSREENKISVVSIYVNPTQFNDPEDFRNYPVTLESDLKILEELGVDYLFLPAFREMYPDEYKFFVDETALSRLLCGASRPGHFRGVLTVVMKLLNIIKADRAYFGEKDYQQYLLIKGMAEAFFLGTEIVPMPVIREESGLALSSRNRLLDEKSKQKAPEFHRLLSAAIPKEEVFRLLEKEGFAVDYVEEIGNRRFGAVFLGGIRLIDNVRI